MKRNNERLAGRATCVGTRRGAESFGAGSRILGRSGFTVSPVGFGTLRVHDPSPLHRRALTDALRGGCNLIETSATHGGGRSERLVGTTLAHLVQQGELRREQIVVVSTIGELGRAQEPGAFIETQLEQSLDALGLESIDVLLLHNPAELSAGQGTSDDTCAAAFERLEALAAQGRIGWYGVSLEPKGTDDGKLGPAQLSRFASIAERVGGVEHRFAVAQLPMNLFELGAVPALADAARADIGIIAHRALNAFVATEAGPHIIRLADGAEAPSPARANVVALLARARKLEAQWAAGLGGSLRVEGAGVDAGELFVWGRELSAGLEKIVSLPQWHNLRYDVIAPHLGKSSAALLSALTGEARAEFARWWAAYGTVLHEVFEAVEADLHGRRTATALRIAAALDPHIPKPWRALPLSQKAVLTVLSAQVSCVVVGMRRPGYVHDLLALREHPIRLLGAASGPVDFDALAASLAQSFLTPADPG